MSIFVNRPSKLVNILDIKPTSLTKYKINVLIFSLRRVVINNALKAIELVLVDKEGTRLHASIDSEIVKKFKDQLSEDEIVTINNFGCVPYTSELRTCSLPFKMSFVRQTKVSLCEDFPESVPEKYFADFDEIIGGKIDCNFLVDVIGQIVSISPLEEVKTKWKKEKRLNIILRNEHDNRLICTLWGDYAQQVVDFKSNNSSTDIVFVIRFACCKEYKDEWLPYDKLMITNTKSSTQFSLTLSSSISLYDEFFVKNKRKTIEEIVYDAETGRFVTCATIDTIDLAQLWYYVSCATCNKKVVDTISEVDDGSPAQFDCLECGGLVTKVIARYYLCFHVKDDSVEETKFLFFDYMGEKLLGKTANGVVKETLEAEDPSVLPDIINDLMGKKLLFKIGVTEDNLKNKNSSYIVSLFWNDKEMVETFIAQSPNEPQRLLSNSSNISESSPQLLLTSSTDNSQSSLASSVTPSSVKRDLFSQSAERKSISKRIKVEKNKNE